MEAKSGNDLLGSHSYVPLLPVYETLPRIMLSTDQHHT